MLVELYYKVSEVSKFLKVSPNTLRRLIKTGRIHAFKLGKGQQACYRISESELHRLQTIGYDEQMISIKEHLNG